MVEILKIDHDAGIGWRQAVRNEDDVRDRVIGDPWQFSAQVLEPTVLLRADRFNAFWKPRAIESRRYGSEYGGYTMVVEPTHCQTAEDVGAGGGANGAGVEENAHAGDQSWPERAVSRASIADLTDPGARASVRAGTVGG